MSGPTDDPRTASMRRNIATGACGFKKSWWARFREVDDMTVYLRFGFEGDETVEVCEMLQISQDGQHRARTWHWFQRTAIVPDHPDPRTARWLGQ